MTAFERLLSEHGVTVLTGHRAERVTTTNGRATGVVTDKGLISARRAVIASVTPQALYGTLLKDEPVPWAIRRDAERFRFGRAAMQIHIALDRPLRWTDERFQDVPLLHISDGSGGTGIACAQADAGALPPRLRSLSVASMSSIRVGCPRGGVSLAPATRGPLATHRRQCWRDIGRRNLECGHDQAVRRTCSRPDRRARS